MKNKIILLAVLVSTIGISYSQVKEKMNVLGQNKHPNIIYILADDMGIGDIGVYGQTKIQTPNIDQMAFNGMKFTQHYSGAAVCAPSRSTLMTGQHTGHTPIRGNKEASNGQEGQVPLPKDALTLAEILKDKGYTTGMFGKWGLGFGEGDPNNQGFDEFYGYNCQKLAHRYYPPYLNHNQKRDSLKGNDGINTVVYSQDKIQEYTLKFLDENKNKSFFAYVPLALPHTELISPKDSIFAMYDGKFEEIPYTEDNKYTSDYGPNMVWYEYSSVEKPRATYATMVSRIDAYVGQIINKVHELGIADNTIIMFASDNGPTQEGGANPDFFNSTSGFRGYKRDLYEGGIRAPFIVVWPNKIKEGSVTNHVSAFWDIVPTITEIVDAEVPENIDGISLVPTLLNKNSQKEHDYLYWEFNIRQGRKAVRMGPWKGVWYNINNKNKQGELELYNLLSDEAETTNVSAKYPEITAKIKQIMIKESEASKLFPFE
ncbi:arylsulfatase [Lutibacter sp. A80]|uniref:arylsulfatase n=1 Tax=Lutibacter sp. A80 TaxID=2918453 RepID=UPI001F05FA93|nr:arylsulfatase [Lutibacter sp. A80]UMB61714.1 arylsulfatase [Lutibacter sp. A80]